MGTDIHSFAEIRINGKWKRVEDKIFGENPYISTEPFGWRSYAVFGFLADVRNYSHCVPLAEPKGLPSDSEYLNKDERGKDAFDHLESYYNDYHSHSYFTLKELLDFDYNQTFWDRRITRTIHYPGGGSYSNGASLAEEGEGEIITYKEHLGEGFFKDIEVLKGLGNPEDVRIIFWFDN